MVGINRAAVGRGIPDLTQAKPNVALDKVGVFEDLGEEEVERDRGLAPDNAVVEAPTGVFDVTSGVASERGLDDGSTDAAHALLMMR